MQDNYIRPVPRSSGSTGWAVDGAFMTINPVLNGGDGGSGEQPPPATITVDWNYKNMKAFVKPTIQIPSRVTVPPTSVEFEMLLKLGAEDCQKYVDSC